MKVRTSTKVSIVIEDEKDMAVWQSLFGKLRNYLTPTDLYKTTAVGFFKKLDISDEERALIEFINEQIG